MHHIILIACSKTKTSFSTIAEKLYQGEVYKASLKYAKNLEPDSIFILSAKYHLVPLDMELEPYDVCLRDKNPQEKTKWVQHVLGQLLKVADLQNDKFTILAEVDYYDGLIKNLPHHELPLKNKNRDESLQWLYSQLENKL